MPEIKFRAWDTNKMEIRAVAWVEYDATGELCVIALRNEKGLRTRTGYKDTFESRENDGSIILLQFTGLKDKIGKEIWEGDIISKAGAFVVWSERLGCWCFDFKDAKPNQEVPLFYEKTGSTWNRFEIIGNIHETPELLH